MTTTAEAVDIIADAFGIPHGTVNLTAKHLRTVGLWPTGRRGGGRGAARVRTGHAVNLAVALLSGAPLAQSGDAVARIVGLPLREVDDSWIHVSPDAPVNVGLRCLGPLGEHKLSRWRRSGDGWLRSNPGLLGDPHNDPSPLPDHLAEMVEGLSGTFGDALVALCNQAVADHNAVLRRVEAVSYDASTRAATLRLRQAAVMDHAHLHYRREPRDSGDRLGLAAAALTGEQFHPARAPLRSVFSLPAEALVVVAEIERGSRDALCLLVHGDSETAAPIPRLDPAASMNPNA